MKTLVVFFIFTMTMTAFAKSCKLVPYGVNSSTANYRYLNEVSLDNQSTSLPAESWELCFDEAIKYAQQFEDYSELFRYQHYNITVRWWFGGWTSGEVSKFTNPKYRRTGKTAIDRSGYLIKVR